MSQHQATPIHVQMDGTTVETAIVVVLLAVGILVGTTAGLATWSLVGGVAVLGHLVAAGVAIAIMVGLPILSIRTIARVARSLTP